MRRWLIPIGGVAAALVAAAVLAVHNLDRFVEGHRAAIEARVEQALGREVTFDRVGVTLWGGVGARITGLRVADDPAWQSGDVLRAEAVQVRVRLLPALWGRFDVRRIVLERPELTVIRDDRGINLEALGRRAGGPTAGGVVPVAASAPAADADPGLVAAVAVARLEIRDGTLRFTDRRTTPPTQLTVTDVGLEASDVALDTPVRMKLTAAVLDDTPNLEIEGRFGPVGALPPALERLPVDVRMTLDDVDLGALRTALPALAPRLLPGLPDDEGLVVSGRAQGTPAVLQVAGRAAVGELALDAAGTVRPGTPPTVDVKVDTASVALTQLAAAVPVLQDAGATGAVEAHLQLRGPVGAGAIPAVSGTVALAGVSLADAGLRDVTTTLQLDGDRVTLPPTHVRLGAETATVSAALRVVPPLVTAEQLHVDGFGGVVDATGRLDLATPDAPRVALESTARGIAVERVLAWRQPELARQLGGSLDGTLSASAQGTSSKAIRRSLVGTARGVVTGGVLRGVNLVDGVLRGVTGIPGLAGLVSPQLRQQHPELFGSGDTRFDELRASARLGGARATVDEAVLRAKGYTVRSQGTVTFDGAVDMHGTLVVAPELTADIVHAVREAKYLEDDRGVLAIPFRVTGVPPDLRPVPDAAFLTHALGRALSGKGLDALVGEAKPRGNGRDANTKHDAGDAIRRGLEKLLGR